MKNVVESFCGIKCSECEYREQMNCKGCVAQEGTPFWGKCEVAECVRGRHIHFCGECGEFPCDLAKRFAYDEKQGDNGARLENCQTWKSTLVKEAREGIDPIGVCGHHCDYCFMGQWCGGCRSGYNCCSYATISEGGKCPNVVCSEEKGLDGCYECRERQDCKKGYYSNENEYVAKATAAFIEKYGKQSYTATLKHAIEEGMNYPKSFDETGSVKKAMELLEKYLVS